MKKNILFFILSLVFGQHLFGQFTKQDSTYIAQNIQRGDSLYTIQLYIESSDHYLKAITTTTHIFKNNKLLPYQNET